MPDDNPVNPPEFTEIPVVEAKGPPKEYTQLIKLANAAFQKGSAEEASQLFKKAFGLYTQNADDWVKFGLVHEMLKQPEPEMAAFKRALSINPQNEGAWLNLARLLLIRGNIDEAIEANKKVLQINAKNAFALMNLGTCYDQKGDPSAAIEAYKKSVQVNPKLADAWFNLAKVQERVQDYENAARNYRQTLRLNPKDEVAKRNLQETQNALKNASKTKKGPSPTATTKGKEPKLQSSVPLGPRFYDTKEMREKLTTAIIGGFFAVIVFYIATFLVSCLEDTIYATMTDSYTVYSNGNPLNEVLALWAVAFTPISQMNLINSAWIEDWLFYLIPAIIAGLVLVVAGKGIKYTLVAAFFFAFWGFILPVIFTLFLPLFFNVSPTSFDAALATSFAPWLHADIFTNFFMSFSSLYLGWSFAGAVQYAQLALLIAMGPALLADLFRKVTRAK